MSVALLNYPNTSTINTLSLTLGSDNINQIVNQPSYIGPQMALNLPDAVAFNQQINFPPFAGVSVDVSYGGAMGGIDNIIGAITAGPGPGTVVSTYTGPLNTVPVPVADISINSHLIHSLAPGVAGTDAVNLNQLNAFLVYAQYLGAYNYIITGHSSVTQPLFTGFLDFLTYLNVNRTSLQPNDAVICPVLVIGSGASEYVEILNFNSNMANLILPGISNDNVSDTTTDSLVRVSFSITGFDVLGSLSLDGSCVTFKNMYWNVTETKLINNFQSGCIKFENCVINIISSGPNVAFINFAGTNAKKVIFENCYVMTDSLCNIFTDNGLSNYELIIEVNNSTILNNGPTNDPGNSRDIIFNMTINNSTILFPFSLYVTQCNINVNNSIINSPSGGPTTFFIRSLSAGNGSITIDQCSINSDIGNTVDISSTTLSNTFVFNITKCDVFNNPLLYQEINGVLGQQYGIKDYIDSNGNKYYGPPRTNFPL